MFSLKGCHKGIMFMIIENLIECSLWRVVIKGLYLWMLRTLWNVLVEGLSERDYVYDYIIECSLWRIVWKDLCLWILRTLWNVLVEGFYWRVLLKGSIEGGGPYVLTFLFWVYVLQNVFYNTYSEMSIIMWFEYIGFRVL